MLFGGKSYTRHTGNQKIMWRHKQYRDPFFCREIIQHKSGIGREEDIRGIINALTTSVPIMARFYEEMMLCTTTLDEERICNVLVNQATVPRLMPR